jgi:Uma2 family endonuclease
MPSATQIPVSEYLQTAFRPDREYVDGEILERNVGKWQHARIQWLLALWFGRHESLWNVIGGTEQRVCVAPTRVRVPDLVVLRPGPQPDVLIEPPLLIIEVLSPDDNYSDLEERCRDYLQMGVEVVWIIDPKTRSGRMCLENRWVAARRLEVRNTPIYVDLDQLFDQIDTPSPS